MRRLASMFTASMTHVSAIAHRHSLRVWLLWGCGVLALAALPIALFDPAVLILLLDPELLALIVVSTAGFIRLRLGMRSERRSRAQLPQQPDPRPLSASQRGQ